MTTDLKVAAIRETQEEGTSIVIFEARIVTKNQIATAISERSFYMRTSDEFEVGQVLENINLDKLNIEESEYITEQKGIAVKKTARWIV